MDSQFDPRLLERILSFLSGKDLESAPLVSRTFNSILKRPEFWRLAFKRQFLEFYENPPKNYPAYPTVEEYLAEVEDYKRLGRPDQDDEDHRHEYQQQIRNLVM